MKTIATFLLAGVATCAAQRSQATSTTASKEALAPCVVLFEAGPLPLTRYGFAKAMAI